MVNSIRNLVLFFLLLIVGYSCNNDTVCEDPVSPRMIIGVFDQDSAGFALDTLIINRLENDESTSLIATLNTDSTLIQLPLSGSSDELLISRSNSDPLVFDTLTLSYDIVYSFVSQGCGAKAQYTNLTLTNTTNDLDSATFVQDQIFDESITHLLLYYTR